MVAIVAISLVAVSIVLYLKPAQYLSTTTALPASTFAADKASIFNDNIQQLYPAMGSPGDLDMIIGTAQLDTVYLALADEFDLAGHYKIREQGDAAKRKAANRLKANTKVTRSDFSELKVKVWDADKTFAPQMANAITEKLQTIHQDIQNSNNISLIKKLESGAEKLQADIDSFDFRKMIADSWGPSEAQEATRKAKGEQVQQYEKLINQYQLLVDSKQPVLIIIDKARVADWPDKPKKLPILLATLVLSILFSLCIALLLEKRKVMKQ